MFYWGWLHSDFFGTFWWNFNLLSIVGSNSLFFSFHPLHKKWATLDKIISFYHSLRLENLRMLSTTNCEILYTVNTKYLEIEDAESSECKNALYSLRKGLRLVFYLLLPNIILTFAFPTRFYAWLYRWLLRRARSIRVSPIF